VDRKGKPAALNHARHFETLFAGNDDPWDLRSKRGERHKRDTIRRALGPARLGCGVELGCGNGITTRDLAHKFAHLLAVDGSASAVALAKREVAGLRHVEVRHAALPITLERARYHAVIASEVLYYLPARSLRTTLWEAFDGLRPGGLLISTNHITNFDDAECTNAELNRLTRSLFGGEVRALVGDRWRCDVYRK
jgi:SAM-dependent methyltransferase